jgi:hypothetical protein
VVDGPTAQNTAYIFALKGEVLRRSQDKSFTLSQSPVTEELLKNRS